MESSYRSILNQTYRERSAANQSYSLRSFARDLKLAPSTLSEILSGKKGLSVKRSAAVAKSLRLPDWQIQFFCDSVAKHHAKSPLEREAARARLKNRKHHDQARILSQTAMKSLTSWLDLAILELTHTKDFRPDAAWVARKLGTPDAAVASSVARLQSAKLLEVSSRGWRDLSPFFTSSDGIPSEAIRNFHKTVLALASTKIDRLPVESRTMKTVVFALSKENESRARAILNEAIAQIVALSSEPDPQKDEVLCFSAQLFPLTADKGAK